MDGEDGGVAFRLMDGIVSWCGADSWPDGAGWHIRGIGLQFGRMAGVDRSATMWERWQSGRIFAN